MKKAYKRWACGLLAGVALLLLLCGSIVYAVDPFCYYRMPEKWQPVFFSERSQAAGLARNSGADTVLIGSSMSANYRVSKIEETLGGKAVRLTLPDGYLSEFDAALNTAMAHNDVERVIFVMDANILLRDESGKTAAMPMHLYNENPLDDVKYLLNKDVLYYCGFVLMSNQWGGIAPADEAFTWDGDIWWNHMTALDNYTRPEPVAEPIPADAWFENVDANLAVVEKWVKAHPDTEFTIFFPPYSILYWDKTARLGQTDAVFAMLERAGETLLQYDNVDLYAFLLEPEIVEDLDNYCDYIHHSGDVCQDILGRIAAKEGRLTKENLRPTLANWQEYVVNYDYDKFWDDSFWYAWNAQAQSEMR